MILFIPGLLYVMVLIYMYAFQRRLVYLPEKRLNAFPDKLGLPYESLCLTTADKLKIHGWFIPAERERAVVLFFHGNAGNMSDRLESIALFHQLALSVLIIDYRGFGESQGRPSEAGTYLDADAAWRFLTETKKYSPNQIIVLGRSLGGGIASWLATTYKPRALILEATFTSIPDVGKAVYPFLPIQMLARIHYNSLQRMKSLSIPLLVVHSREDEVIPFEHGQQLFAAANGPKTFLEICCSHSGGFLRSENYKPNLDAFITKVLSEKTD
ncbi:conserved hypothetical protein [Chloroherpeton thalassium ATCC 35110]|uniref:Serine aminopeptidase S33 domain-containing protein n=1 Tax=Chloroherpeton thalassium (strain ATCC 35110 / GB-78) TaxID=517418 RepID=B3QTS9_CHLT3|nr:alpha/beta hydrolase [Chloroherpeton thalassium]ACF14277.1 conserved hypothetical protein [Chloroherpeton thalassium ATCC 35110]